MRVADPVIEARGTAADGTTETVSLRLDQLAAGSEEEGGVIFEHEPEAGGVVLVPRSLTLP